MESWILLLLSISFCLALKFLIPRWKPTSHNKAILPPGPSTILLLAKALWQKKSLYELELILRNLHAKYGPIITLRIASRPTIFIADRCLAHQALVQNSAVFADRPPAVEPNRFLTSNQHNISSSTYGPLWRLLRRNLTAEILHPSRIKLFAQGREWALQMLSDKLRIQAETGDRAVVVTENFQFAMFCLLVLMCFGEKVDEKDIKEIKALQNYVLLRFTKFNYFAIFPKITKVVFQKRWNEILEARRRQAEIFIPLIKGRQENRLRASESSGFYSYADSLIDLRLTEEEGGRKLREDEMVSLCHEFLSGGIDTTSTALEWIMAELVKHKEIQKKLLEEIKGVVVEEEVIKEDDLQKMPYLKAVVLEGLRRHPPGHFVLPHRAAEDVILNGRYLIPKGAEVLFNVADIGWDEKVWEEPMEFRPERFSGSGDGSGEGVDITGSKEIKMMPFGAGRRMCPGYGLAMLHLEYFVANLVREFEWNALEGEEVDLSEKLEFTTVMKNPLRVRILPRRTEPLNR